MNVRFARGQRPSPPRRARRSPVRSPSARDAVTPSRRRGPAARAPRRRGRRRTSCRCAGPTFVESGCVPIQSDDRGVPPRRTDGRRRRRERLPVSSTTSSARTMRRRRWPGSKRRRGVDPGKLPCSAAAPISASRCSHLARTAGSVAGNAHSSSSDWMYIIDPPTMIGSAPAAEIRSTSAAASCW